MKIPKKVINAIKKDIDSGENPTILYYDNQSWEVYADCKRCLAYDDEWGNAIADYFDGEGDGYIPTIAHFLVECTKQGIDITKIKLESM